MKKKLLIFTPVTLLVIGGVVFALERTGVTNFYSDPLDTSQEELVVEPEQKIDYSPASPTDNDDINKQKESGFNQPSAPTPTTTAYVTITRAIATPSSVELNALLSGVSDGGCTATISNGSTALTSSSIVTQQDQYTYCANFTFDRSKLSEGKWQVEVSVTSADGAAKGTGKAELQI